MSEEIRCLIVDDQAMVREGFSALLNAQPGIRVVGQAADGAEAVVAVTRRAPASFSWTFGCR
jgi:DNA-binding NarL/FixJ family response regulator